MTAILPSDHTSSEKPTGFCFSAPIRMFSSSETDRRTEVTIQMSKKCHFLGLFGPIHGRFYIPCIFYHFSVKIIPADRAQISSQFARNFNMLPNSTYF